MTGKRSARTPAKLVDPSPRKNAGLETPRAPEEGKKRQKAAEEAASKSPISIRNKVITRQRKGSQISTSSCG